MSDPEVVFALARGQNAFFRELAEALVFELEALGGRGRITTGSLPDQKPGSVTVLLPPHEFVNLSSTQVPPSVLRRCVVISAEQPTSGFFATNVEIGRHAGAVMDINSRAVRAYAAHGIEAEHLQLGYSSAWDMRDAVGERDVDVVFIGRATDRRERALAGYADVLERFNCEFILSGDDAPSVGEAANYAAEERKLRLLARSKVLLNVHGEEEPYFEWLRAAEAISSGCVLVSEHSTDLGPLRPGVDLVTGSKDSLGFLTAWVLDDEERRAAIARDADARLRSHVPLSGAAARLLAAARRVDAVPVTPRAEREARVTQASIALASLWPRPQPPVDDGVSPGEKRALRALKRQQHDLLALRRLLAAEALARSRPERPAPETVEEALTPAWSERVRPLVSVIVPLYNDADVVTEALDSVDRSTMSSWELVVVDDASTDASSAAVRDWMERHPDHRVALVRHEVNRGLAAARNSGADQARGELLLMLDSDNLIRPFGLARLTEALRRDPGADFAYGMLDRIGAPDRIGIVSKFAWEPQRLRSGNYIDALALIRRRALFELGGYSEDPRLALGLEDYDFWVRIAEAGRRGAFVRQFVGSYRAGHSTMLSVTGISTVDAMAAIAEHAPGLMHGVEIATLT